MAPFGASRAGLMSVAADDIPDTAEFYWLAESFSDPWLDAVIEREMSVSGLTASTTNDTEIVSGDGTDGGLADISDFGSAWDGQAAIEFAISTTDNDAAVCGYRVDEGERLAISVGSTSITNANSDGVIGVGLGDANGNLVFFEGSTEINDGSLHSVVLNKTGNSFNNGDFEILVDNEPESLSLTTSEDDDLTNIPNELAADLGFWSENRDGFQNQINADIVGFGFHSAALSEATLL